MTTFNGTHITKRFPQKIETVQYSAYLPIGPPPLRPDPENGVPLHNEHQRFIGKYHLRTIGAQVQHRQRSQSYVQTFQVFTIDKRSKPDIGRWRTRLTKASFYVLMQFVHIFQRFNITKLEALNYHQVSFETERRIHAAIKNVRYFTHNQLIAFLASRPTDTASNSNTSSAADTSSDALSED